MTTTPFAIAVLEGQTVTYTTTLLDEASVAVPAAAFTAIRLTYYSVQSGAIINSRNNQSILNANEVTVDGAGLLTWKLQEADVTMTESPKPSVTTYRAVMVYEWLDAATVPRQAVREIDVTIQAITNGPFTA
jgi:hypothetical protein